MPNHPTLSIAIAAACLFASPGFAAPVDGLPSTEIPRAAEPAAKPADPIGAMIMRIPGMSRPQGSDNSFQLAPASDLPVRKKTPPVGPQ